MSLLLLPLLLNLFLDTCVLVLLTRDEFHGFLRNLELGMLLHAVGLVYGVVVCCHICGDAWPLLCELRSLSLLVWRHDYDLVFSILRKDGYIG